MNTIEQLRRLAEAREKATAGPWKILGKRGWIVQEGNKQGVVPTMASCRENMNENAAFIALAGSTDFRSILAEFEKMQAVVEAAKLKRNAFVTSGAKWIGQWIAVPREDFDALRNALDQLKEQP